ncbi:anti-sigma factor [Paenibacillus azoreducens]|uniref:Anti-sigma-W factor RsiW n=1 Tax=Paenibacillus azoreducens TaxID=116718 RepID=A0A919YEN9_9BACL|nr:zf-HC2 domain-containing protein [Paenibacillus azoreducens]GIO47868.1 hypothetical protein J34TS1_26330 [Paenibacillus azoreducens]
MNCSEVVEWMHRYLDYDLSEEETVQLYEHLKQCPECAETFRMLKSLSRDLEDLPKVTPKFSIVDAIMPQLDAIDQAQQEKSASREEAPAEMVPVPVRPVRTSKFRNSVAGRTVMGAAAAVIILGVAIYNYPPKHLSTAEEPAYKAAEQKNADSAASKSSSGGVQGSGGDQQTVEPKQELYSNDTSAPDAPSEGTAGSNEKVLEPEPPADQELKTLPPTTETPTSKADEKPLTRSVEEGKVDKKAANNKNTTPETPAANDSGTSVQSSSPSKDAPAADASAQDKAVNGGISGSNAGETPESSSNNNNSGGGYRNNIMAEIPTEGKGNKVQEHTPKDDTTSMGITSTTAPPTQVNSPDGKYAASVEDNKLVIYSISDSDGQKKSVKTIDLSGSWVSGVWSADSTVFTYQTSDNQGATTSKTVRVESPDNANP